MHSEGGRAGSSGQSGGVLSQDLLDVAARRMRLGERERCLPLVLAHARVDGGAHVVALKEGGHRL